MALGQYERKACHDAAGSPVLRVLVGDDAYANDRLWAWQEIANKAFGPYKDSNECDFCFVSTPEEFVEQARNGVFDLGISDRNYVNPGDGVRALRKVRGDVERRVLWTSSGEDDTVSEAERIGAEYVHKVDIERMQTILDREKQRKRETVKI